MNLVEGIENKKVYTGKRPQTLRVEGMYQTQATVAMEPRNNESKTRTTPQRERSHTPKVTRGLREHMSDSDQTLRPPRKMNIEKVKNDFLPRSQPLFCQGLQCLQSIAPATKIEPEASEVPHLLHGIINMAQIKFDDSFTKTQCPTLSKRRPSSPNTTPATKNDLQNHLSFGLTRANVATF